MSVGLFITKYHISTKLQSWHVTGKGWAPTLEHTNLYFNQFATPTPNMLEESNTTLSDITTTEPVSTTRSTSDLQFSTVTLT